MAAPVVTLDGLQLHPLNPDNTGYRITSDKFSGWYGRSAPKTAFSDRPAGRGVYFSPAYPAERTIAIGGFVQGADRDDLLAKQRVLASLCLDPFRLYELRVDEDLSLFCRVQLSGDTLFKHVSDRSAEFSLQVTAPDPRLLDPDVHSVSTLMAQSSGLGIPWRGTGAATNLLSNPDFESTVSPWTVTGGTVALHSPSHNSTGGFCAMVTPDGTSSQCYLASEKVALSGTQLQVRAWVGANFPLSNFSLSVNWFDSAGTYTTTASNPVSLSGGWTLLTQTLDIPAGAAYAQVVPTLSGTPATTDVFYVDDASLSTPLGINWRGADGQGGLLWRGVDGGNPITGIMSLDNPGTAPADILFTITGPAVNPSVRTATQTIIYGGVLGAGDVLTIDTGTGAVLLNGVNRRPYLTSAEFFTVPPGRELDVLFTCEVQNAQANCTATWHTSYI